jgi:hypothetical protein
MDESEGAADKILILLLPQIWYSAGLKDKELSKNSKSGECQAVSALAPASVRLLHTAKYAGL